MMTERIHRDLKWSPQDRARHREIRERFQSERPTMPDLLANKQWIGPFRHDDLINLRLAVSELVQARESAGHSVTTLAARLGVTELQLHQLETGSTEYLTVLILMNYASAIGKRITFSIQDEPALAS